MIVDTAKKIVSWLFTPQHDYPEEGWKRIPYKLVRIPFMLWDAVTYPPRRRNSVLRVVESVIGLLIVMWSPTFLGILIGILAEIAFFETVEALGLAGYYWERGPREGESPDGDGMWLE